jgi:trehalose-phosphatase
VGRFYFIATDRNRGRTVKHLFKVWDDFSAACRAATHILLLADYDGTLATIVGRPADAILSAGVRQQLINLARQPEISVGVISGRSIEELKSMVGIEGIYYSGNHGLEIEGPGFKYTGPTADFARTTLKELAGQLAAELADIAGVIIQDKGLSLSVHYRLAAKDKEKPVTDAVRRLTTPLIKEGKIRVYGMKKVWEIRPPVDWDKGKAVEAIEQELKKPLPSGRLLTIYLGDDTTDEDAFRIVCPPMGWSIFVGEKNRTSAARYYLPSVNEVAEFLARLNELKSQQPGK